MFPSIRPPFGIVVAVIKDGSGGEEGWHLKIDLGLGEFISPLFELNGTQ